MRSKWLVPFVLTTGVACGSQQPVTHTNPPAPPESTGESEPVVEPETSEPAAESAGEALPDPAAGETAE